MIIGLYCVPYHSNCKEMHDFIILNKSSIVSYFIMKDMVPLSTVDVEDSADLLPLGWWHGRHLSSSNSSILTALDGG